MKVIYKYDGNFMYKEPVILEPIFMDEQEVYNLPDDCTEIQPPDGLYLAKFDKEQQRWFESASQEYIDGLINDNSVPLNDIELLKRQNASLILDSVKNEKQIVDMRKQQASLILSLTEKGVL